MNPEETLPPQEDNNLPMRKVGVPRFFELLGRDLWSFYKASFLCCLGFLPGFALLVFGLMAKAPLLSVLGGTAAGLVGAPFLCGLLDTILRALRDEPGYWWHTYRAAWRQNWRDCLLPGLAFGFFFGLWVTMIFSVADRADVPTSVWLCLLLGLFLGLGFFGYLFVQIPLVSLPLGKLIKNAGLMFLGFLPRTLLATLVTGGYWALTLLYLPYTVPVLLALGFWLPCLISTMILYPGLDKVFDLEKTIRARRAAELDEQIAQHQPTFENGGNK